MRSYNIENKKKAYYLTNLLHLCYCGLALPPSIHHPSRKARPMVISNYGQVILKSQIELSWGRKFGFPFEKAWWFLWALQEMRRMLSCFCLRHLLVWNSCRVPRHDVWGMAAWEIPLLSPLEVSTIWTAITQQRKPCSMDKPGWEISHTETYLGGQVRRWE